MVRRSLSKMLILRIEAAIYVRIYQWALVIPVISVFGVLLAAYLRSNQEWRLASQGYEFEDIDRVLIPADHSQLVGLFFTVMPLGFALPMLTIYIVNRTLFSDK